MTSPPRAELAVGWATALSALVFVPTPHEDVEAELGALLDDLLGHARAGDHVAAAGIGARLVDAGFATADCLRVSLPLLRRALTALPELDDDAVAEAVAAVAVGFTEASRERVFTEQRGLRESLLHRREDAERELAAVEERFEAVFAAAVQGMVLSTPDGRVLRANEALEVVLEHPAGTLPGTVADLFHPEDRAYLLDRYAELVAGDCARVDEQRTRFLGRDGEPVWVRVVVLPLRDRDGATTGLVTMVGDLTDLHLLEHKMSFQDTHDPLTGLPNRDAFVGRLEEALETGAELSVLHLGLDDLAVVNDGLGRAAGDRVLREVANRLESVVEGRGAAVARIGGDEFAVLLPHTPTTRVGDLPAEINDALAEPTYVAGGGTAASATIAVARLPARGTRPEELLAATDAELRALKAQGKRQWGLVDADENARRREHHRLAASIPGAWESGELSVEFERVLAVPSGEVTAARALLRWDHPDHGPLDDARCRALLADTGLGVPLGHWVLERALDADLGGVPPYLELTVEQAADPDLVAAVGRVLTAGGSLELGLPVAALCEVDSPAEENLGVLVDLGVRTVLTGFGRTRGDLACLEDLGALRAVSLDATVVGRVAGADGSSMFVRAVRDLVPMVRDTGRSVIAGGITDAAQLDWWVSVGVDRAFGPHLGGVR
ncbi:diguanylate cyclase/phosphodiesterase (GGDEF & EAL domain) with PAS/PAC sensor(s) [Actinokineospora spheciospongiae]|uniref:Diguanylate cyclase/phosphodiesterase (GGDEF & EAL domain) with PAS/PAC sensor(S) n=1 Tax=Actinokineospora spheciospongiae TaxID=909613 RepID=W7J469_9PSEU|nr:diguanylate cyclase [Actinokineospora spheciospongiae]EWC60934.1 diguanylate cyclase/phosphodiesterase (GGDEF & EAL domain) with PAS/PAC sensor(s) [Actinokineospora spheciospongiae]